MNAKSFGETLSVCVKNGLSVLVKGAPGVGKTDVVKQVAKKINYDLLVMHPVVSDPTDIKGLPCVVEGKAMFLPFGDLQQLMKTKKPTIAFLDDLGQAPATVQASYMQPILAGHINDHFISDKVVWVAATNRREDRAGVTGILEPVKSRFSTILELIPDAESWIDWAFENNMPTEIIGFIHFRPTLLHTGEATADIVNHPCPRTIAFAGKLINAGLTDIETLSGSVGAGCAAELVGFMKIYKTLPNISAIILKPEETDVPTEPAALYAVVTALVEKASPDNVGQIFKYANRLPADFSMLLMRDMVKKNPKIQNTSAFIKWAQHHKEILM
jgi:hypothetical protein